MPLGSYLHELLIWRRRGTNSIFVFPGPGKTGYFQGVNRAANRIARQAGVEFMPHDCRRSFITVAESLDIPFVALKRLLNHRSRDITESYIGADVHRLREPMQRIEDAVLAYARSEGAEPAREA